MLFRVVDRIFLPNYTSITLAPRSDALTHAGKVSVMLRKNEEDMGSVSILRINLFNDAEKSFLSALDAEGVKHSRIEMFSAQPQASGVIEAISALSEAMPWNAISKVMVEWIDARKSRKIIITTKDGQIIHAEGYSINELEKILHKTTTVAIIDTQPIE